jgi:hypothetical protein
MKAMRAWSVERRLRELRAPTLVIFEAPDAFNKALAAFLG